MSVVTPIRSCPRRDDRTVWDLVAAAQAGDSEAFGALYDRYVDDIYRFVYSRVRSRELAEDLTAETFVRAMRNIGSLSFQGKDVVAWLLTIARNLMLDHLKSAGVRRVVAVDPIDLHGGAVPSSEELALDAIDRDELRAAVEALPDRQRKCVQLRFVAGYSVRETAHALDMNEGAVRALQLRALRKLAEELRQPLALAA